MPHFENLEHYETTNRKSGEKEIVPIAPHSLQKTDYRPRKREGAMPKAKKAKPDFPEVEIEPISVRQMEREFRMAARKGKRGNAKRRSKPLLKRLSLWLRDLLGLGKKKKNKKRRPDSRGPRSQNRRGRGRGNQPRKKAANRDQGGEQGTGNRSRRRRNRSGNKQGEKRQGDEAQKQPGKSSGGDRPQRGKTQPKGEGKRDGKQPEAGKPKDGRNRRNRRNRGRPRGQNQSQKPSSGESQN